MNPDTINIDTQNTSSGGSANGTGIDSLGPPLPSFETPEDIRETWKRGQDAKTRKDNADAEKTEIDNKKQKIKIRNSSTIFWIIVLGISGVLIILAFLLGKEMCG